MLTKEEADIILMRVCGEHWNKSRVHRYRFGQAIYNELPVSVAVSISGSEKDMYYEENDDKAIEMLMALVDED